MCAAVTDSTETIVLYGIEWEQFKLIANALGECHPRFTYANGALEMWSVLHGVNWENYRQFLDALGDCPLRHMYSKGTLEMMSPRKDHDWRKRLIGRFIEAMTMDLRIAIQSMSTTTLTTDRLEFGLQPDEAYYVQHEAEVRDRHDYDSTRDPPPDLVLEVDVTSSSADRLPGFAAIGAPEVWRHDGKRLHFLALSQDGKYREAEASLAFPFLSSSDVVQFLDRAGSISETDLVIAFVEHARRRYENWRAIGPGKLK